MATEQEWKLNVPNAGTLDEILAWEGVRELLAEPVRIYRMKTTYYDAPDRRFAARRYTLRRRMENETSVLCVKAPVAGAAALAGAKLRGEWEVEGPDLEAALPALVALGAPADLLEAPALVPVCGAAFTRRAVVLGFADGSACELALDQGTLRGSTETQPLCEAELELKRGGPGATLALLARLEEVFGLRPEPKSKYARAKALG